MTRGMGRTPILRRGARMALALVSVVAAGSAWGEAGSHHYTQADRYAGCLVGYLIPALRRGSSHDSAMTSAEDKCFPLSEGLSERDLRDVVDQVNYFVAVHEAP